MTSAVKCLRNRVPGLSSRCRLATKLMTMCSSMRPGLVEANACFRRQVSLTRWKSRFRGIGEVQRNPYHYTVEKLTTTLECLITHPGDARERLTAAFLALHTLSEKDFPPEHRKKWRWVMKELTKFGPLLDYKGDVWRGSVENTMRRVRKQTASRIIKAIYELYWVVSENEQYF